MNSQPQSNQNNPNPGYKIPYDRPTPKKQYPHSPIDNPLPPRRSPPPHNPEPQNNGGYNPFRLPRRLDHIKKPDLITPKRFRKDPYERPSREVDKQNPFLNRNDP